MNSFPSDSFEHCPDCMATYHNRALQPGEELLCRRCGKRLKKYCDLSSLQAAWALVTASVIFLGMANYSPLMIFDVSGNTQSNLMITGVTSLFLQGYWPLALLVFCSAIVLPSVHLLSLWYLLAGCCLKKRLPAMESLLNLVEILTPWNLIPVFAVSMVAAAVKLDQVGDIEWKEGTSWIALLAISSLIMIRLFDKKMMSEVIASLPTCRW
ncbi:MAG: paraquat-inducible protein A [Chthoniobacterales bacterium]|nr:paraquat-inducible protein A [Chthoniobacterales bacterium]